VTLAPRAMNNILPLFPNGEAFIRSYPCLDGSTRNGPIGNRQRHHKFSETSGPFVLVNRSAVRAILQVALSSNQRLAGLRGHRKEKLRPVSPVRLQPYIASLLCNYAFGGSKTQAHSALPRRFYLLKRVEDPPMMLHANTDTVILDAEYPATRLLSGGDMYH
jgi:hypothetical protein